VLFIGTQFSNLYTTVDTPAEARDGAESITGATNVVATVAAPSTGTSIDQL
jgi:hypothetical protein